MIDADKLGDFAQGVSTAKNTASLAKVIIAFVIVTVVMIFFMTRGVPIYIGLIFIGFMALMVVLTAITLKKTATVEMTPKNPDASIKTSAGEKIKDYIAGVMLANQFKWKGVAWFGTGKLKYQQNTILLTNKQILFIIVPVKGADKMINGTNVGTMQWILSKGDVEKKLKTMMKNQTVKKIANCNSDNFAVPLSELKKVKVSKMWGIKFFTTKGNFNYVPRDKNDIEKAKKMFAQYL